MHKLYIVCPVDTENAMQNKKSFGIHHMVLADSKKDFFGIFANHLEAQAFASTLAGVSGGIEIGVFECNSQFYARPARVSSKIWKGLELVPA